MNGTYGRREFLKQAAAGAAMGLAGAARAAPKPPPTALPVPYRGERLSLEPGSPRAVAIVDTHQHLWDLKRFRLPWIAQDSPLNRSFLPEDYRAATARLNVVKAIYMEVAVEPAQQLAEAEYALELCARDDNPMVAAVIGGNPGTSGFKEYITRFKGNPRIKGVRGRFPAAAAKGQLDEVFVRDVRLLGSLGMSFDMNVGPDRLPDCLKLVEACGDTRFILDHCGNPSVQAADRSQWEYDLAELGKKERVVCKISGIVASAKPKTWRPADLDPIVKRCIDAFGWDRVMFGGDWPVCTLTAELKTWAEALLELVRYYPPANQRKLFSENAIRFYRLL